MFFSDISKLEFPDDQKVYAKHLDKHLLKIIIKDHPNFSTDCLLSFNELQEYRNRYLSEEIFSDIPSLSELETEVILSLHNNSILTEENIEDQKDNFTLGQRLADRIASFGGSWTFIILFFIVLICWIITNVFLLTKAFDPYPFILMNLVLSCLAALQAPVIMMSQNRQEEKDRIRAKSDYKINLKSELEIRMLHEKVDRLIIHQHKNMLETQQIQIDMLNDIIKKLSVK